MAFSMQVGVGHIKETGERPSLSEAFTALDKLRKEIDAAVARLETLSRRERQVLACLAEGGTTKSIAETLELSPSTVEKYRKNMLLRLRVPRLADAMRLAFYASLSDNFDAGDIDGD